MSSLAPERQKNYKRIFNFSKELTSEQVKNRKLELVQKEHQSSPDRRESITDRILNQCAQNQQLIMQNSKVKNTHERVRSVYISSVRGDYRIVL